MTHEDDLPAGDEEDVPAARLVGFELDGGWQVVRRIERGENATGGFHSVQYVVERDTGSDLQVGFMKALDYTEALEHDDRPAALNQLTACFKFEQRTVDHCTKTSRMSRVVSGLDSGSVIVPDAPEFLDRVDYLIFEAADGDIRAFCDDRGFDIAWALQVAHHVAVGLRQLHAERISHRDLKPSNAVYFENSAESKVADLGRAHREGDPSPFDVLLQAGDGTYAAPELLYRYGLPDQLAARRAGDIYQLGGIMQFVLTRVTPTAALCAKMAPEHWCTRWQEGFEAALPFLSHAFNEVCADLRADLDGHAQASQIVDLFAELCDPDPRKRGNRKRPEGTPARYDLERVVTRLDLLAKRSAIS